MNLSTKQLRAFRALCDTKSFTQAARDCHLSQSAFSALIQHLETDAGVRLFERSTRRVELTVEGAAFAQTAARLLADFEAACEDLRQRAQGRRGRVAVAALPSLAAGVLGPLLAEFRQRHPAVHLEVFDVLSDECTALVRRGRADFAIAAAGAQQGGLSAMPLCEDDFFLVCARTHRLAQRRHVALSALRDEPFVHLARNTSVRQQLDAHALPPGERTARTEMEVAQLSTAAALVAGGLGVALIPALALYAFARPDLSIVPLRAAPRRQLCVIEPAGRSPSVAAALLLDAIRLRLGAQPGRAAHITAPLA